MKTPRGTRGSHRGIGAFSGAAIWAGSLTATKPWPSSMRCRSRSTAFSRRSRRRQNLSSIGLAIGITLLGWGIGGMLGGVAADYIGRKRMMMLSILGYALLTGLTAF